MNDIHVFKIILFQDKKANPASNYFRIFALTALKKGENGLKVYSILTYVVFLTICIYSQRPDVY